MKRSIDYGQVLELAAVVRQAGSAMTPSTPYRTTNWGELSGQPQSKSTLVQIAGVADAVSLSLHLHRTDTR